MKTTDFYRNSIPMTKPVKKNEAIFDNSLNIRIDLLTNTLKRIQYIKNHKQIMSLKSYYKEHASLYMDFGSQTGSSFFLHWFLNWCTDNDYKTITLFYNLRNLKMFIENHIPVKYKTSTKIDNHILETYNKNILDRHRGYSDSYIDFIVIDVSSVYKSNQINTLIKEMAVFNPELFIFL